MTDETEKTGPTYTVSGNHLRLWRLDADGQPEGEAIEVPGHVSFDIPAEDVLDARWMDPEKMTLEVEIKAVDPAILALLTGQGKVPEQTPNRWDRFRRWLREWWETLTSDGMTDEERREFHKGGGL